MIRGLLSIVLAALMGGFFMSASKAQLQSTGSTISGSAINRSTVNGSVTITTGNTFQTILASTVGTTTVRQSLTIQNNQTTTDNCWVFVGSGTATKGTSILLQPGGSYTRYWPYVPSDAIQATCASNSDTLYLDTQ